MIQNLPAHTMQSKLLAVCRQLQQLLSNRTSPLSRKIKALTRRRDKYVKRLQSLAPSLSKAAATLAAATLMTTGVGAQTCRTFANADAANPITVANIPNSKQPYFVDIDGDGDLDCYVIDASYYYDAPFLLKNVGTNKLPSYQGKPSEGGFPLGYYTLDRSAGNAQFIDIDGDGDYDCFLSEEYGIFGGGDVHIRFYENQGTPASPHFVKNDAANPVAFARGSYEIGFTFADMDGDGDYDLYYYYDFGAFVYQNTGTRTSPQFTFQKQVGNVFNTTDRTYYDWNRDGLTDYFQDGKYYKNVGPKKNPRYQQDDAEAPVFGNGAPHQFTDINSDGAPEVFSSYRGFSTLAPVPVIDSSTIKRGDKIFTKLSVSPVAPGYTYQWYLHHQLLPNAKSPSIPALYSGYYTATITDSCGTGVSRDFLVANPPAPLASALTGADKLAGVGGTPLVTAYPNPFANAFTLRLGEAYNTPATSIKIVDMQGRVISSGQPAGSTTVQLGGSLAKGVYLLQVWQKGIVVFTQKLIKQ